MLTMVMVVTDEIESSGGSGGDVMADGDGGKNVESTDVGEVEFSGAAVAATAAGW